MIWTELEGLIQIPEILLGRALLQWETEYFFCFLRCHRLYLTTITKERSFFPKLCIGAYFPDDRKKGPDKERC